MSDPVVAVMMLGLFIFMVLLGFPIAFTLIAMGLGFGYYAYYDAERMQTICLLYTSPSPRDGLLSRMPSSA